MMTEMKENAYIGSRDIAGGRVEALEAERER
jgi:hypothetical protein